MAWGSQRLLPREGLIVGQGVGRNKPFEYGVKGRKIHGMFGRESSACMWERRLELSSQTEVNIRSYPKHKKESL